jgi:hypothetical protein
MRDRWAAPLLALPILLFHARVLFTSEHALPWDMRGYHLPLVTAVADAFSAGEFPYWEPYSYCGRPLAANPQVALFYPTVALAAAFGRDGLLNRLEWNVVLHVWLAAWFTFRFARRLNFPFWSALTAGLIYSLGGFYASQVQHMGSVMAAAWLPFAWEAAHRQHWGRVTVATLMAALAGFTPMTLVLILTTLAWNWRMAGGVLAGLALAAFQLGPAYDLMRESVAQYRTDWLRYGGGLPLQSLASLVWPNAYGIFDLDTYRQPLELTFLYVFCGWLGLAFAIHGARYERKLLFFALACAVAMLGEFTPIGKTLFPLFPEFVRRSFYWYPFLAPFCLATALLAAAGLPRMRWAAAITALVAAELVFTGSGRPMNTQSLTREPGISETQIDGSPESLATVRRIAGRGRIDTIGDSALWSSGAPISRIPSANGYDPLALEHLIQVRLQMAKGARWGAFYQIERPSAAALQAMAIRALVTRAKTDAPELRLAAEIPGRFVYEVKAPAERIEWPGQMRIVRDSRNEIAVRLSYAQAATLTVRDAWSATWRAHLDGQPVELKRALGAFRAVDVPAGDHEIRMTIDHWHFWRWSLVSAAALVACAWARRRANAQS